MNEAPLDSDSIGYRLLIDAVVDYAIYMLDPAGKVASWNPGAQRIQRYAAEEIVGRHFSIFYTEEDIAAGRPEGNLRQARATGRSEDQGWRLRKGGVRFWASVVIEPVRDEAGQVIGYVKVTRDLTERRQAEQQLAEMTQLLSQSQKMEALGQLTGGIAHDFNNLLAVIGAGIESVQRQLKKPVPDAARVHKMLGNALRATHRAGALVQHLLAFARRQPLDPKPIAANDLVAGMSALLRRSLGERILIEEKLDDGLWRCFADQNQLESALLNLAINARDAMPGGGKLTIATRNVEIGVAEAARRPQLSPGPYVSISVTDTGIGMSREVAARAFDPFYTTKPPGKGTGLGLSQVYGFITQSGGHVEIASEVGRGTTVTVLLPRHFQPADAVAKAEPAPANANAAPTGSETILVVEDDADVRTSSTEMLRDLGYRVLDAPEAASAMALLREHADVALLFTDVVLPGALNGRDLADEARRVNPRLKVLFTTGYAKQAVARDGQIEPGLHLISKPFNFADLAVKIREVLDTKPLRPCVLLVEDEALVRAATVDALHELGFEVEEAASAMGAMSKLRHARSPLAAVLIDVGLPDLTGDVLAAEIRAARPGLPIVMTSGRTRRHMVRGLRKDPLLRFLPKPYDERDIEVILKNLRVPIPVGFAEAEVDLP